MNQPPEPPGAERAPDLLAAYDQLQNLLLAEPDVVDFLQQLATLSASLVSGASCGLTLRHENEVATVTSSDEFAKSVDEIQYGRGQGPCLQALHTGERVDVPLMAGEQRWPDYSRHALAAGVGSSVSLPLTVAGDTVGALNFYSRTPDTFPAPVVTVLTAFARQATNAVTLLLRHARHQQMQDEITEGMATRAVIDQALGIVMAQRKTTATAALAVLREAAQHDNRRVSDIAAELITSVTGHPPEAPRPFTHRG